MKCKICNGTFKPCSFCDGTGEYDENEVDRFNAVDFIKVMEMVKKPQTNEDWFCQLPTEEKAKFLWRYTHDLITDWEHINDPMFRQLPLKNILGDDCTKKGAWVEWLKQPHNNE